MEKLKNIKKIIFPLAILIIMIGAIVVATVGFKFDLMYQSHKRIEIYIDKDYSIDEVKDLVKNQIPGENIVEQGVETFNKDISITVKNISEEQEANLENAINEKYELEEGTDSVVVIKEAHLRLRDIMKPYVKPLIISSIIICVYLAIRFRKTGAINALCIPIGSLIVLQALYFSVIAICRIPVSKLTMPISLLVYILTVISITVLMQEKNKNQNK